jgi:hypothetical protein
MKHPLFTVTSVGATVRQMVLRRTIAVSGGYLLTVVQKWGLFQEHPIFKAKTNSSITTMN